MNHMENDMGMSDLQFKNHLRGLIAELERNKADGESDKAEADIEALVERFKAAYRIRATAPPRRGFLFEPGQDGPD